MRLELIERKPELPGVESFVFKPQEPLVWKAGQFLHYVLHHEPTDARGSDRWFTVSSAPSESHVMLTTRFTEEKGSSFKRALAGLKRGDQIEISDVDGDFTIEDYDAEYVFIAGGIGITPFRAILMDAEAAGKELSVTLLYANRDEHIPFKKLFDEMAARNRKFRVCYFTGQRIDEAAIRAAVSDLQAPYFYVSGPEPMVESFGTILKGMDIAAAKIKQDWFPGYPAE